MRMKFRQGLFSGLVTLALIGCGKSESETGCNIPKPQLSTLTRWTSQQSQFETLVSKCVEGFETNDDCSEKRAPRVTVAAFTRTFPRFTHSAPTTRILKALKSLLKTHRPPNLAIRWREVFEDELAESFLSNRCFCVSSAVLPGPRRRCTARSRVVQLVRSFRGLSYRDGCGS